MHNLLRKATTLLLHHSKGGTASMETIFSGFSGNPGEGLSYRHLTTNYSMYGSFHRHESYEFYLFLQGNANCYVEQHCFHMERGDLIVIRPGQYHRPAMLDDSNYERVTINISEALLSHLSTEQTDLTLLFRDLPKEATSHIRLTKEQLHHYLSLIEKAEALLGSKEFGSDLLCQSCFTELFVFINRTFRSADDSSTRHDHSSDIMPKLIRDLLQYIDLNLTEKITLDTLEKEFFLNGTYISRQFKKHTGLTLREYLLERRITYARSLLAANLSVTEVSMRAGFPDYANFIRSFTKTVGISPGKYARARK